MVATQGKSKATRKHRLPKYFFLEDKLYQRLHVNRPTDVLIAWSYPDDERVRLTYSYVLKHWERGFTTKEVCTMINRDRTRIWHALKDGNIDYPPHATNIETGNISGYYWREKDVMKLHDYFLTVHRGRPRLDGEITPQAMPTKRELRAMMRQEEILYVKQGEDYIPTWRAKEI
jgi:hypothetical protein